MNDCSNHKKDIAGISDMKELAEMIGDLHYKSLAELLFELQTKFHNDSMKDLSGERFQLSHYLRRASHWLFEASIDIGTAWRISKPFMKSGEPLNNLK